MNTIFPKSIIDDTPEDKKFNEYNNKFRYDFPTYPRQFIP